MPSILAKIGEDRCFLGAILLVCLLLATPSPFSSSSPGKGDTPRWEEYSRVFDLEQAPALTAFSLRVLTIVFLTLFLAGLAMDLQGLTRRGWRVFPPGAPPRPPWGVTEVVKLAVYFLAFFLLLLRLEKVFLWLSGVSPETIGSWLLLANAFLQFFLLLGLSVLFLGRYRSYPPAGSPGVWALWVLPTRGYILPRWRNRFPGELRRRCRQALKGYICFFPLLILLGLLAWGITQVFHLPWQSHPLVEPLLEERSPVLIYLLLMVGVVFAPLAEEVFFRGLLFPALTKRVGMFRSSLVTAALFATLHFNWFGWLPIFGLGILLARSFQRTGSLLVPIFIHAFHNALFLTFTILAYQTT